MSIYGLGTTGKSIDGLRVNLWEYLAIIKPYVAVLADRSRLAEWFVEFRDVNISSENISFDVLLNISGSSAIQLDTITQAVGYSAGKVLVDVRGVWLSVSSAGGPITALNTPSLVIPSWCVVVPNSIPKATHYTVVTKKGLDVSYNSGGPGGIVNISLDRSELEDGSSVKRAGVRSINGIFPVEGNIDIQGSGEVAVGVV